MWGSRGVAGSDGREHEEGGKYAGGVKARG